MTTLSVGIREAKSNLSKLLRMVEKGNEIVLTDRGRPVGKIVPFVREALPLASRVKEMEYAGIIEPTTGKGPGSLPPAIPVEEEVAQRFLKEEREGAR